MIASRLQPFPRRRPLDPGSMRVVHASESLVVGTRAVIDMTNTPEEYEESARGKRARITELEEEVRRKKSLGESTYSEEEAIRRLDADAEEEEERARTIRYGPVINESHVADQASRDAAELWGQQARPQQSKYMRGFEV